MAFDNYGMAGSATNSNAMMGSGGSGGNSGGGSTTNSTNKGTSKSTTNSNQTTKTTEVDNRNTTTRQQNMSDSSLAALEQLIATLQSGGTEDMQRSKQQQQQQIAINNANASQYSKAAAFGDAKGAMDEQTRKIMDSLMPTLARNAEGAGTSQNAMRALLTQQGAIQAAEAASTVGVNAAAQYGNVANGIQGILAQLVGMKDPAADALLQALGIAKGAVVNNNTQDNSTRTVNSNTVGNSVTDGSTSNNVNSNTAIQAPESANNRAMNGMMASSRAPTLGGSSFQDMRSAPPKAGGDAMYAFGNFNPIGGSGLQGTNYGGDGITSMLAGLGGTGY